MAGQYGNGSGDNKIRYCGSIGFYLEVLKMKCPKCGKELSKTETNSLWCENGCYESEYALWVALTGKEE